jgi:hypothetical protein
LTTTFGGILKHVRLSTWTIWLYVTAGSIGLLDALGYLGFSAVAKYANSAGAPDSTWDLLSSVETGILPILDYTLIPAWLAASVLEIVLLAVVYRRVHATAIASGTPLKYGPGWAVGAWFIPIANLWILPRIMRDSLAAFHDTKALFYSGLYCAVLVGNGLSNALAIRSARATWEAETFDEIIASYVFDASTSLLDVALTVATIIVLVRLRKGLRSA